MTSDATAPKFHVPYRLDFVPGTSGRTVQFKPGRGAAGWTIATFDTREAARAFVQSHPDAEMPCWRNPSFLSRAI